MDERSPLRILLVSPSFFGYERSVAQAIRETGHEVDLFDERPSNRAWQRALVRVAPKLMQRQIDAHYRALAEAIDGTSYDALLVIKGEVVPRAFVEAFAAANPSAVRAYYTFDSLRNSPQGLRIVDLFDLRYTFDRRDARADPSFAYKPLFYAAEYRPSARPRELDVSFIGTLHGDRWEFVQAVAAGVPERRRRLFFFIPAAWYYWVRRLTSNRVRGVPRHAVQTTPLSRADVVDLMQNSRVVIDMQRHGQHGLTMRTFEALATGAALITSNGEIVAEPFYDPSRILVVPREPSEIDADAVARFVRTQPDVGTAPPSFHEYSLANWVEEFVRRFESVAR